MDDTNYLEPEKTMLNVTEFCAQEQHAKFKKALEIELIVTKAQRDGNVEECAELRKEYNRTRKAFLKAEKAYEKASQRRSMLREFQGDLEQCETFSHIESTRNDYAL